MDKTSFDQQINKRNETSSISRKFTNTQGQKYTVHETELYLFAKWYSQKEGSQDRS